MTETRHMWVAFHQHYYTDQLVMIDLMAIEAVVQDEENSTIRTATYHYRVHESVEEVMAIMRKHLDGRVT